jgi:hypothetical protein
VGQRDVSEGSEGEWWCCGSAATCGLHAVGVFLQVLADYGASIFMFLENVSLSRAFSYTSRRQDRLVDRAARTQQWLEQEQAELTQKNEWLRKNQVYLQYCCGAHERGV